MPRGETSYMMLSDFSTGYVASLTFAGAVKFCVRPPAANPKWVLIASDAGEIRVFNQSGVHQPDYDIDLGWNPDQVSLNNETPPKILIYRAGTTGIYLYESGVESWNVTGISNLIEALVSDGWVHTLINNGGVKAANGVEWRSLVDGAVDQAVRGISGGTTLWYSRALAVTEAGELVFWMLREVGDPGGWRVYVVKEDRTAGVDYKKLINQPANITTRDKSRCSASGNLAIVDFYKANGATTYLFLLRGSDGFVEYSTSEAAIDAFRLAVNPAGTRAGYLFEDDLHKLTSVGAHTTVVMGANIATNLSCFDISDDPSFVCVLNNGDMEIYDDSLVLKATIDYELADSPVAVVRNT